MKRSLFLPALCIAGTLSMGSVGPSTQRASDPVFLQKPTPWADSVFAALDLDGRIAQLMMVAAYSNRDAKHVSEIEAMVKDRRVGGLIFFQGGPGRQVDLTNKYQAAAAVPLWIGMDLEWGLAMRLDSTIRFPRQMTLGAHPDEAGLEAMGREIARQMQRIGAHVSFSPVADVNNNAKNPVINDRSFGEDRELVTRKALAYARGLEQGGVIPVAKHFPGHGDTDTDSHHTLPFIAHGRARLDSVELYPFRRMVQEGVAGMMIAHLEVPALDSAKGVPTTLSRKVVYDLLQQEMGFKGLIFTDALNMRGVAAMEKPGDIELRALAAGNDVLLFPQDPLKAIERIHAAIDAGELDRTIVDEKCLKILRAKEWAGVHRTKPIAKTGLARDLRTAEGEALRRSLYADAITVLRNDSILPIKNVGALKIASLVIGAKKGNAFQQALARYGKVDQFSAEKVMKPEESRALLEQLKKYDVVIASVHGTTFRANKEFGVPQLSLDFLRRLGDQQKLIYAHFANPYRLATAYGAQRWNGILVAYEENDDTQDLMAQAIFGALPARGRLPVGVSSFFPLGAQGPLADLGRLRYGLPGQFKMASARLQRIDSIVGEAITAKAFPGCQVVVAHNGGVVWNKAYGSATYESRDSVHWDAIYDLASISKVMGTTLALMHLQDQGRIHADSSLGTYMPEIKVRYPVHAGMKLSEILTHQAGFKAFVPFYTRIMQQGAYKPGLVAEVADATHTVRFGRQRYLPTGQSDSLVKWVLDTPLGKRGEYLYSDMGMYLLQQVVERVSGMGLDRYLDQYFYTPLGLTTMGFNPWQRFPLDRIMPTENDKTFRKQLVHGDVHDPGAAMMGGVAGHAGLFSNANDLAILGAMLLRKGEYGGVRYLSAQVIDSYTACRFCKPGSGASVGENRRGLGWDKPQPAGKPGPACDCVSYTSYGHTGFTGTQFWADPQEDLVYVFLSNRVYPDAENRKIGSMNVRTRIQEVVYAAIVR